MSTPFAIFQTKHKASKPTRFKAEKISERREKPQFLKVHLNKTKNVLEASGFLTGSLQSVVENISKHKKHSKDASVDQQMYYNVNLMIAGLKKDLEKFLLENLPTDTYIAQELKEPYLHLGPLSNFNERWLLADMSRMLSYDEALQQFADLRSTQGDNYEANVSYYHSLFTDYFRQAEERHRVAKENKEKVTLTFEQLRDSLGPFKYAETGSLFLKHIKNHMGEVKKKESKKTDVTFDKYFVTEPNVGVRVYFSNSAKTGTTSLVAKKEPESSIMSSSRSKAFRPFPQAFPHLYFNNENIYDAFMYDLKSNIARVAGSLAGDMFKSAEDVHIKQTDSDTDKLAKIDKFFNHLETEYSYVRQQMLFNNANRQFNPIANVPVSSTFRV